MFRRIKSGWQLTKKSWRILSDEPGLIKFPIVGGLIAVLIAIVLIGPGLYLIEEQQQVLGAILAAVGVYLAAFATFYFAVGLAHNADQRMRGEEVALGDGMALQVAHQGAVLGAADLHVEQPVEHAEVLCHRLFHR